MSRETIRLDFKKFIETYITSLNGKIRSAFPQTTSIGAPLAVIQIPVSTSSNTISSGSARTTRYRRLIRVYIINDSPKGVDDMVDTFCQSYNNNLTFFTSCHPFNISYVTDAVPLFEEKYNLYVGKIDINVIEFI